MAKVEFPHRNKEWLEQKYVNEGLSTKEIGEICGISYKAVWNWLKKLDIPTRTSQWTKEEIAKLKREYKKESPDLIRLSKELSRLRSNICRKAKQLGLGTSYNRPKRDEVKQNQRYAQEGWSPQKEFWFLTNYNRYTNKELAKILECAEHGIEKRLRTRGLIKNIEERGWWFRNGHPRGMKGKTHSDELKRKTSERFKQMWADPNHRVNSEEYRQMLSDRAVQLQKNNVFRNRYSRSRAGKRDDLGIYVRSSWEANFARYLNWMKGRGEIKDWKYEVDTFDFPVKRGTRFYTPDFKVWENDDSIIYYEVKGWMTQQGQTALNRMKKYFPEIKIILFAKKEYNELKKWKRLIPNWE